MVVFNLVTGIVLALFVHPWAGLAWLFASFGAWAAGAWLRERDSEIAKVRHFVSLIASMGRKRCKMQWSISKTYVQSLLDKLRTPPEW